MKKNIFYTIIIIIYSVIAFGQDSLKINKSHFSFQTGYANYHFNFNGVYMSGGYNYTINKYLLLTSDVLLSSGTKMVNTKIYRPHYELRAITIGSKFQVKFFRRNTLQAGAAITASTLALSDIASKFYYVPYNRDVEVIYFIKKHSLGYQYSLTYMYRVNNRLQIGINFSHSALEPFHRYKNMFTSNLSLYGVNLNFSF
jgi:hypothetical protein